jgi:hypothetical protein
MHLTASKSRKYTLKHNELRFLCSIMPYQTNNDNIYSVGTMIFAKEAPTVQLQIKNYYQRIYYCGVVGSESAKNKVFFERELIAPGEPSNA